MNLQGMVVSIVTAMLAMAVFASSAIAITVDSLESPFHERDGGRSAGDNPSGDPCDIEYHGMELRAIT